MRRRRERGDGRGGATLPKTITFSNWPLYIDVTRRRRRTRRSTQFEAKYDVNVNYIEDINDNDSFFGKIEGPLSQGQSVGRDIVVLTDSSGLPQRMIQLGWLEKLDKSAMPNIKNLHPGAAASGWDPNREYSLPVAVRHDGHRLRPEEGRRRDRLDRQAASPNPKLKGKVTLLTEIGDTMGLVMLANGDDPSNVTREVVGRAPRRRSRRPSTPGRSASSPATTTRRCSPRATSAACFAWSGDMVQLQADHPGLKWIAPKTGAMIWTDNMLIPKGGNVYARVGPR